ncbi:hypothetical protein QJS66_21250 [Kocuria rhizophila]|nr:hypothetical protein QJS66_21250 [Kocuria rhizophila]
MMVSMAVYGRHGHHRRLRRRRRGAAAGWGRQLALTPMGTGGYAATKVAVALLVAVSRRAIVFLTSNTSMDGLWRWALAARAVRGGLRGLRVSTGLPPGLISARTPPWGPPAGALVVSRSRQRVHAALRRDAGRRPVHPHVWNGGDGPLSRDRR